MAYEWIAQRMMVSRKRYRCIWCGELIEREQHYIRVLGKFEGDFQNDAYHLECRTAAEAHFDDDNEFDPFSMGRPLTSAQIEYESWDCAAVLQARLF